MKDKYPSSKEIIYLLGMGTLLVATVLMPGLGYVAKVIAKTKQENEWKKSQKEWLKFNQHILKYNLKRLRNQKVVEIMEMNGEEIIRLTQKGRTKFLKFKLEELSLKGKNWDKKWRVVIYDIPKFKRSQQSAFRYILKYINFLQLQKSVYLTPYDCEEHIEYLREYFGIGEEVLLIRADKIENEETYKQYFGL